MPTYDRHPRYPMIIYDPKSLGSNWMEASTLGSTKSDILDEAVVGHVLRFEYAGDLYGPTHDKRPQLLVLGSTSPKMLGDTRVRNKSGDYDRIHGINLRYLTSGRASSILNYVKVNEDMHMTDPYNLVKGLRMYYNIDPPIYRQYLNDRIIRISKHWTYVSDTVGERGSVEEDIFEEFGVEVARRTAGKKVKVDISKLMQYNPKNIKRRGRRSRLVESLAILYHEFMM